MHAAYGRGPSNDAQRDRETERQRHKETQRERDTETELELAMKVDLCKDSWEIKAKGIQVSKCYNG